MGLAILLLVAFVFALYHFGNWLVDERSVAPADAACIVVCTFTFAPPLLMIIVALAN